ncbi:putative Acyltransferase 3 domain-containing protein [Seiridium unicorne]|uniref:Acyltransferase 3 domain-containing protein n=1 Tax=Seiridium unicorne TaxID=138068 RepID=A0ABR2UZY2_9PEZI
MSQQVSEVLDKMRSVLKMTEISYHQLPQGFSQQENLEQGQGDTEKQSRPPPLHWYWCLLPWPLAAALGKTTRRLSKRTPTSYLNGVRGIACMIIYTQHVNLHYYKEFIGNPYGADPPENNHGISQIPIIRVMYAGKGMNTAVPDPCVASSSIISAEDLITGLCSSILRRGVRLFAPMLVLACMSCLLTWYYPSFSPGNWRENDPTFFQHVWRFVGITLPAFNPFQWDIYAPLSFNQCWTLPVEYRGSIVVFLMCMATAQLTTRARKIVILGMAIWALYWVHGDVFAFLTGMFLAELRSCPLSDDLIFIRKVPQRVTEVLSVCVLLLALMLMGWPENGDKGVEPFKAMSLLIPAGWGATDEMVTFFWSYTTAPVALAALENLPSAQWLLSTKPVLYLGEISFSFYLLHWMGFLWPGWEMMIRMVNVLHCPMDWSFYLMYFTTLAMLVVSADVFWRLIDEKCVSAGKGLAEWLVVHTKHN